MENTQEQHKKQYDWLKQYQFQKGQSGNPGGARKGKKMKTMAAELLQNMSDEEKAEWLKTQDLDFVWKMAEGMPDSKTEATGITQVLLLDKDLAESYGIRIAPESKDSSQE